MSSLGSDEKVAPAMTSDVKWPCSRCRRDSCYGVAKRSGARRFESDDWLIDC